MNWQEWFAGMCDEDYASFRREIGRAAALRTLELKARRERKSGMARAFRTRRLASLACARNLAAMAANPFPPPEDLATQVYKEYQRTWTKPFVW